MNWFSFHTLNCLCVSFQLTLVFPSSYSIILVFVVVFNQWTFRRIYVCINIRQMMLSMSEWMSKWVGDQWLIRKINCLGKWFLKTSLINNLDRIYTIWIWHLLERSTNQCLIVIVCIYHPDHVLYTYNLYKTVYCYSYSIYNSFGYFHPLIVEVYT